MIEGKILLFRAVKRIAIIVNREIYCFLCFIIVFIMNISKMLSAIKKLILIQ